MRQDPVDVVDGDPGMCQRRARALPYGLDRLLAHALVRRGEADRLVRSTVHCGVGETYVAERDAVVPQPRPEHAAAVVGGNENRRGGRVAEDEIRPRIGGRYAARGELRDGDADRSAPGGDAAGAEVERGQEPHARVVQIEAVRGARDTEACGDEVGRRGKEKIATAGAHEDDALERLRRDLCGLERRVERARRFLGRRVFFAGEVPCGDAGSTLDRRSVARRRYVRDDLRRRDAHPGKHRAGPGDANREALDHSLSHAALSVATALCSIGFAAAALAMIRWASKNMIDSTSGMASGGKTANASAFLAKLLLARCEKNARSAHKSSSRPHRV